MTRTLTLASLFIVAFAQGQTDSTLTIAPLDSSETARAQIPIFSVTLDDLDSELGSQDVSGILQSSRDIFTSTAGFNFGSARFRVRGYESEYTLVTINGVLMNDLETGWASWALWGGLNDVTRYAQVRTGIGATRYNFGSVGGTSDINVRSSSLRKGIRMSYASTNRAYRNRIMVTGSTGLLKNGWSFSFSGSRRWAEEGYVEGTSYNAYAYYLAAEHKINSKHSVSFSGLGAPMVRGRQGIAIQEAYDLSGTNYYNPNWGYQNGEKRNSRMAFDHKPLFMFSHYYKPDSVSEWNTSLFYTFGRDGSSGLNWFDAKDPRPDYYRYLPSYYEETDPAYANQLANSWRTDPNARQIDWDQMYFANSKNLYSVENADGIEGNTVTGNRSKYIQEEMRADPVRIGVNSVYNTELSGGRHLTVGGSFNHQKTHYFKVVEDLLGGDYWVDIDQFAERDFSDTLVSQNDLDRTNKIVGEGDVFGWDYDINIRLVNAFVQLEKKGPRLEGYVGGSLSQSAFWRFGNVRNGRFPDDSEGKGAVNNFFNFGVKAGGVYKVTGRHYIAANAAIMTRPPAAYNAFLSARTRSATIPGLSSENILSGDIGYIVRLPRIKGRATLYYAQITD
ncbi:MAG: Plug domain-containing protein, partial [Flavobacteriales bacterium]|nr:Plug domain-containing protein [Flavobacteriales bacterium]